MAGRAQVVEVVKALRLRQDGSWSWMQRHMGGVDDRLRTLPGADLRKSLRQQITDCLYRLFYTRGGAVPASSTLDGSARLAPEVQALAERYRRSRTWTSGWNLLERRSSGWCLARGGITVWASPNDVAEDPAHPTRFRLRQPAVAERISPGFLLVRGGVDLDTGPGERVLRLYWHLNEGGAQPLFEGLTGPLDKAAISYRFKIARYLGSDQRCDAAVLYSRSADWPAISACAAALHRDLARWLGARTPAFTLPLAPGLALAEDPADGESFGRMRSALLADCMLDAWEQKVFDQRTRIDFVLDRVRSRGFDPDRLYLDSGSDAEYTFVPLPPTSKKETVPPVAATPRATTKEGGVTIGEVREEALAIAQRIAMDLCDRAWWSGRQCTWVGATPISTDDGRRRGPETWASLGANIYGGVAGVAFYLAEMHAAIPDPLLERTFRSALARAISMDDAAGTTGAAGLYTGRMGIAAVQGRIAVLDGDRRALRAAVKRGRRAASALLERRNHDLLAGKAGGILGLLALSAMSNDESSADLATKLGDDLLATAVRRGRGRAWGPARGAWPLTGYSHGASGVAHALAELHAKTREQRFVDAMADALRYENSMFDPVAGNWPDFRVEPGEAIPLRGRYPTGSMWCHGAPGVLIALRRIAALQGADASRSGLERARRATVRDTSPEIDIPIGSWCLCHGVAGNLLALVHGGGVLPASAEDMAVATRVLRAGVERYAAGAAWPCGVGGGWSPAYMVGAAGTGAFFMGVARPSTPSFLIAIPSAFAAPPDARVTDA